MREFPPSPSVRLLTWVCRGEAGIINVGLVRNINKKTCTFSQRISRTVPPNVLEFVRKALTETAGGGEHPEGVSEASDLIREASPEPRWSFQGVRRLQPRIVSQQIYRNCCFEMRLRSSLIANSESSRRPDPRSWKVLVTSGLQSPFGRAVRTFRCGVVVGGPEDPCGSAEWRHGAESSFNPPVVAFRFLSRRNKRRRENISHFYNFYQKEL